MSEIIGIIIIPFAILFNFRSRRGEKILAIIAAALLVVAMDFYLPQETVRLEATGEGNESAEMSDIEVMNIYLDGKEIPFTSVFAGEVWKPTETGGYAWRSFESSDPVIEGRIRNASKLTIHFSSNQWRGIVKVTVGDKTEEIDCFGTYGQKEFSIDLPEQISKAELIKFRIIAFLTTFFALALINLIADRWIRKKQVSIDTPLENRGIKASLDRITVVFALILFGMSANKFNGWVAGNLQYVRYDIMVLALLGNAVIGYSCLKAGQDNDKLSDRKPLLIKIAGLFLGYLGINVILNLDLLISNSIRWKDRLEMVFAPGRNYSQMLILCFVISGLVYILFLPLIRKSEVQAVNRVVKIVWLCSWWGYILLLVAGGFGLGRWIPFFFIAVVCGLLIRGSLHSRLTEQNALGGRASFVMILGAGIIGMIVTMIVSVLKGPANSGFVFFGPTLVGAGLGIFYKSQSIKDKHWLLAGINQVRLAKLADLSVSAYFIHIYIKNHCGFNILYERISANGLNLWNALGASVIYYILSLMIAYVLNRMPFVVGLKMEAGCE